MEQHPKHPKHGAVRKEAFFSPALGISKQYQIYLPPGYQESGRRYPVLYLFRGHEKEWFDPYQDHSRGGTAIQHLADELIQAGKIGEMIIVGVSMTSDDGEVYGLGINFLNPEKAKGHPGIGSGKFEDYFTRDLISHIDTAYRTIPDRAHRGADGFSLGGFCSVMLAIKHPELFASVGSYDGSFMFRNLNDPRYSFPTGDDTLWVRSDDLFAPAFRRRGHNRYDIDYLLSYNSLNLLEKLPPKKKALVQATNFYIKSAAFDGFQGNRDRSVHLVTLFQLYGIKNRVSSMVLSNDAHHNWKFADLHIRKTLPKHSRAFGLIPPPINFHQDHRTKNIEIIAVENAEPAHKGVTITYDVHRDIPLKVDIFNLHGEHVITLKYEQHHCGRHSVEWTGRNTADHWVSSDLYFVQFNTPAGTLRQKFVFLR